MFNSVVQMQPTGQLQENDHKHDILLLGVFHAMALDSTGRVTLWGDNSTGQLAPPPELDTSTIVKISAGE
jgi:alpha-tubulin suppressor-like RCC1 family protein